MIAPYARACSMLERSVRNSAMSLPGENAFSLAPRRTMQRMESSAESVSMVSPSDCQSGLVIALSFAGRSMTTVAMNASRSIKMDGSATSSPGTKITAHCASTLSNKFPGWLSAFLSFSARSNVVQRPVRPHGEREHNAGAHQDHGNRERQVPVAGLVDQEPSDNRTDDRGQRGTRIHDAAGGAGVLRRDVHRYGPHGPIVISLKKNPPLRQTAA